MIRKEKKTIFLSANACLCKFSLENSTKISVEFFKKSYKNEFFFLVRTSLTRLNMRRYVYWGRLSILDGSSSSWTELEWILGFKF